MTEQELDKMLEAKVKEAAAPVAAPAPVEKLAPLSNVTEATDFSKAIDAAKIRVVEEASANDTKFIKDFQDKLKEATLKQAELEREKAQLEKQNVEYHQELLQTQQELNQQEQAVNIWENKQKKRQYHYDGVKPIMQFVGVNEPMNLFILYFLTVVLTPFFLLAKLFKGTVGALLAGAESENRPAAVKGFLWTILALVVLVAIGAAVVLVLHYINII